MTDDIGWSDFGYISGGGATLGHPTPNIDRLAKEGTHFTSWYGQASCTAGRSSFMTGRIPIRSALSVVVVPGDRERFAEGNADHRRVLQEERLRYVLLRQVASWRRAKVYPIEPRLRRNESSSPRITRAFTPTPTLTTPFTRGFRRTTRNSPKSISRSSTCIEWEGRAASRQERSRDHLGLSL